MSVKSSLFGVFVFTICFTSVVSFEVNCTFLTFGQDVECTSLNSDPGQSSCCYGLLRNAFCCNNETALVNLLIWMIVFMSALFGLLYLVFGRCENVNKNFMENKVSAAGDTMKTGDTVKAEDRIKTVS